MLAISGFEGKSARGVATFVYAPRLISRLMWGWITECIRAVKPLMADIHTAPCLNKTTQEVAGRVAKLNIISRLSGDSRRRAISVDPID